MNSLYFELIPSSVLSLVTRGFPCSLYCSSITGAWGTPLTKSANFVRHSRQKCLPLGPLNPHMTASISQSPPYVNHTDVKYEFLFSLSVPQEDFLYDDDFAKFWHGLQAELMKRLMSLNGSNGNSFFSPEQIKEKSYLDFGIQKRKVS